MEVSMTEEKVMRRRPQQARSQQRVDDLLNTAESVFAEIGYEAATTNLIAARAGISIGSLYQFFPNKEALLDGIAERYITNMRTQLDAAFAPETISDMPITTIISQFIDGLIAFKAAHSGFDTVFMSSSIPVQQSLAVQKMHEEIISQVDALLASRFPDLSAERRRVGASIGVAIVKGLMPLAEAPDGLPTAQVLLEAKTAVLAYLRSFLLREGHPLPPDLT
jgi:AcrR family transcriptional regulator